MAQFSYSFCMAMLHSLWQAALLMLLYLVADKVLLRNNSPLAKRNFLFGILLSQLLLFVISFFIYYTGNSSYGTFSEITNRITALAGTGNMKLLTPWIFSLYLLVTVYKLVRSIYSWFSFKQRYHSGLQRPTVDLKLFTEMRAQQFGIKKKVKLWFSTTINTPVTFGFFKPVILLPVSLVSNISIQQAETLILHELTHIRTNDYLFNWLLIFVNTLFFYNPIITGLCNRIRMEREKNCDMNVMAFEYSPILYAETLLQAERIRQGVPVFQLAAVNRKEHLLERIRFFSREVDFNRPMRFNIITPITGLLLLIFFSSAVLFQSGNTPEDNPSFNTVTDLPFNSMELAGSQYINNPVIAAGDLQALMNETEKQKPAIEKRIKENESLTRSIQKETEALVTKQAAQDLIIPVSVTDNDGSKHIIITEESSGADKTASMRTYSLRFENGQWILEPEWNISAKEIPEDSLIKKMDSSGGKMKRILPAQQ